jgi:hypothetical protein
MDLLIENIQAYYHISLTNVEKKQVTLHMSQLDLNKFKGYPKNEVYSILAKVIGEAIISKRKIAKEEPLDMHEYLSKQLVADKKDNPATIMYNSGNTSSDIDPNKVTEVEYADTIAITSLVGQSSAFAIQNIFNPTAAQIKNYVVLDSKYRNIIDTSTITNFNFAYVPTGYLQAGTVNSIGNIKDVVSMRLYKPIIPYVPQYMNVDARRISITINEFSSQSYILSNGRRAHWILAYDSVGLTDTTNNLELSIQDFNDGIFTFQKPITTFDTLTVSFGNPDTLIPFKSDRDTCTFTYGNPTIITTTHAHEFATSATTYITITSFTTNNTIADANTIAAVNNLQEYLATSTGTNTMEIPINTSSITAKPGLVANVYYEDRRFILPIEFTYLRSDK